MGTLSREGWGIQSEIKIGGIKDEIEEI